MDARPEETSAGAGTYRLPGRGQHTEAARLARLDHLRRLTGVPLLGLEKTALDASRLCCNVEALIGGVEVPVGVAGPLQLDGAAGRRGSLGNRRGCRSRGARGLSGALRSRP